MSKSQLSLEFIVMVGMGMTLLAVFLFVGNEFLQDSYTEQRYTGIRDLGYSIQSEIILAARSEIGYNRTFTIPNNLGEYIFDISSTNKSFELTIEQTRFTYFIPLINGSLVKGDNTIITNETEITIYQ